MKSALVFAACLRLIRASLLEDALLTRTHLQDELAITASGGLFDQDSPKSITGGFVRMRKAKRLEEKKAAARAARSKRSQLPFQFQFPSSCFPASNQYDRDMNLFPSTSEWWCNQDHEYAFLGFTYDISSCPTTEELTEDFTRMRMDYEARYVRITGACDENPTYNGVVEAAWSAGIGVYASLWLGHGEDSKYLARISELMAVVKRNVHAPYVIRNIAVGSDTLFEGLLSPSELALEITSLKALLKSYHIEVVISELPTGIRGRNGMSTVLSATDKVGLHVSPFFGNTATEGDQAWNYISSSINYVASQTDKPLTLTQTGWPSNENVFKANSNWAVADIANQQSFYELLDSKCEYFKERRMGWFAHTWSEHMLSGWGLIDKEGLPKYEFAARTSCEEPIII